MKKRRPEIDWLRIGAVLLLFDFHAALIFTPAEFYLQAGEKSRLLYAFVLFVKPWLYPLFFFLCGAAAFHSLSVRSRAEYVKDRSLRLLVPLAFGVPVLAAPQAYLHALKEGSFAGGFIEWLGVFFFESFDWCHLWFLAYLFVFSMICLPLFEAAIRRKQEVPRWWSRFSRPAAVMFLLALVPAALEAGLRSAFPPAARHFFQDWADVLIFLFFFAAGFWFQFEDRFSEALDRYGRYAAAGALALTAAMFGLMASGTALTPSSPAFAGFRFLWGLAGWFWVVTIMAVGRAYLTFENGLRSYANQAALPLYLIHQTAIVGAGFWLLRIETHVLLQFFMIDLAAFFITILLYQAIIKRTTPLRLLFGMRRKE
ncbi:MAG: acyltransferase family protein [bacterium]